MEKRATLLLLRFGTNSVYRRSMVVLVLSDNLLLMRPRLGRRGPVSSVDVFLHTAIRRTARGGNEKPSW
ncbi:hypothetical protein KCP71_15030 [Salmonella enterica subsp. enterica]|nr:hypothetical protein KCP71_15030 [Salmonella enterica subsp. enterica]